VAANKQKKKRAEIITSASGKSTSYLQHTYRRVPSGYEETGMRAIAAWQTAGHRAAAASFESILRIIQLALRCAWRAAAGIDTPAALNYA